MISQQQIDEAVWRLFKGLVIEDSDRVSDKSVTKIELDLRTAYSPGACIKMFITYDFETTLFFLSPETAEKLILYLQEWLDYRHYLKDEN